MSEWCPFCAFVTCGAVDSEAARAELAQHVRRDHPEQVVEWFAAQARREPDFEVFRSRPQCAG
jgi:hypothetical protein